jgi:hypothetical protein
LQGSKNVVEQNSTKGEARLLFCGTQNARTGHFALTVCYVLFFLLYTVFAQIVSIPALLKL